VNFGRIVQESRVLYEAGLYIESVKLKYGGIVINCDPKGRFVIEKWVMYEAGLNILSKDLCE
jgi:hypothetical protein